MPVQGGDVSVGAPRVSGQAHSQGKIRVQCQQHDLIITYFKDMFWHNKMCSLRYHPHQNILPKMPCEKPKSPVRSSEIQLVESIAL